MNEIYSKSKLLFSLDQINESMDRMAEKINKVMENKDPIVLCVMCGGIVTYGNLLPKLNFPLQVDYIHATRYGEKTYGDENVQFKSVPSKSLKNRTVLIVDDILDEGLTLSSIIDYCYDQGASEVFVAVLIDKIKQRHEKGLQEADFICLTVDEKYFIIGYGLDDPEGHSRNLPGIYAVEV